MCACRLRLETRGSIQYHKICWYLYKESYFTGGIYDDQTQSANQQYARTNQCNMNHCFIENSEDYIISLQRVK